MNADDGDSYKIVVLGDSGAGKTSVIFRYAKGSFDPSYGTTIGTSFVTKKLDYNSSLKIWDTAGQERYRSIVPMYCHDAAAIIIVFDVTSSNPVESVERWMNYVKDSVDAETPIFVVGNKADLVESDDELSKFTNGKFLDRQVYVVSTKTGKNVELLFDEIANHLIGSNKRRFDQKVPQNSNSHIVQANQCC
ncbi:GTP-binding protein YPT6 [Tritrichomonas foetus]|uniref:GTP-binding protein YPT6 n=1 Tax=Tritrichomonas foetus TaxID=1144522 RepID=A0A1J4JC32_9EUKA|nr:GTP-binding protein YPT6 [Tritrichomonas foetus]|eukprot:OHS96696.1 GTP-binding protein YPT6 [Tritrichomonas foetus]